MEKIDIVLGDWSDDGHGKYEKITILVNQTKAAMQLAYKDSCKALGISFNHNDDFTGIEGSSYKESKKRLVCAKYQETTISEYAFGILTGNYDLEPEFIESIVTNEYWLEQDDFVKLLMAFIDYSFKKQMIDFHWEYPSATEEIPVFNGFWDDELNVQLGYGLYN